MISVESIIYKTKQKLNKLATNEHQDIPIEDVILVANEAQIKLIKEKVGQNNIYLSGIDSFKKRYQDLEVLIESAHNHQLTPTLVDKYINKWSVAYDTLTPQFMFYVDSYAIADKDQCRDRLIYVNNDLTKHSDVTVLLNNSNYKPSFEYQETFSTLSDNNLEIYTDGTFDFVSVHISYLRYPKEIDYAGYVKLNGQASITQDSELPDYMEDELVELMVQLIAGPTENPSALETAKQRKQISE